LLNIVCCYVEGQLRPEAERALTLHTRFQPDVFVTLLELDAIDDRAYGRMLAAQWARSWRTGSSMAIVEPDIVVRADVINQFVWHPAAYIAYPYTWSTNVGPALGCTRFSAAFIERYPGLLKEAVATGVGWQQLDVVIMRRLLAQKYGEQPTVLLPPVEHLNEAKRLLPDADPTPMMYVPTDDIGNLA
jgi:hypothetical protein